MQILHSIEVFFILIFFLSPICVFSPSLLLDFWFWAPPKSSPVSRLCGVCQQYTHCPSPSAWWQRWNLVQTPLTKMPSGYLLGAFVFAGLDSPVHALSTIQLLKENKDCDRKVLAGVHGPCSAGVAEVEWNHWTEKPGTEEMILFAFFSPSWKGKILCVGLVTNLLQLSKLRKLFFLSQLVLDPLVWVL